MTQQSDIIGDARFVPVLDYGFVGLIDHMGSDEAITQAARISYGTGTKSIREDRGLIRYLFRHHHTSPIEMCEVKLHIRLPIFVMRQLVRHRTAALNEYSARYSEMSDEFYVPDTEFIQPQSTGNKQGRDGSLSETSASGAQWLMRSVGETAYDVYRVLLGDRVGRDEDYPNELIFDPYVMSDPLLDAEFPGIARELARTVMPVSYYTEVYWKQNLHNLFHLLKLRTDHHAQREIRVFADAIYNLIKPVFPLACEAWEDYVRDAVSMSRMELRLIGDILRHEAGFKGLLAEFGNEAALRAEYGLAQRELEEFKTALNIRN